MRARLTFILFCAAALAVSASVAHAQSEPSTAMLGQKIANLSLKDDKGKTHRLYELEKRKAIVIVFLSFDCPVSNSYTAPLSEMAKEFEKFGVTVWGLTANDEESADDVARHAKKFDLTFPVFKDERLRAAHALKADFTPEVFVLDGEFVLQYRGRIDNMYSERLKKHKDVTEHNLRQTIAELATGRPVSVQATQAIGCKIYRGGQKVAADGKVTYHRDVLPILQNHCQSCHRPGEVGPFSLMTYRQAVNWAQDIKDYTQRREMPPWKAAGQFAFHNERQLSDKDIKTLAEWVDGGTPQGDPKDAPAKRDFVKGWQLGEPDLILTPSDEYFLGPSGKDIFQCFVLPTGLDEDKYVSAVEVRPGNPRIVHHVLTLYDKMGNGRKLEKQAQERAKENPVIDEHTGLPSKYDRGPGYSRSMGIGFVPSGTLTGWAPGYLTRRLPEGVGMFLPKKSDVVIQVHYHRNGRAEKDRTQVGLYFCKSKVDRPFQPGTIVGGSGKGPLRAIFSIPPGADRFPLDGDMWATKDFTLLWVMPHMHMLGKEINVTMTPPDGPPKKLLAVKSWDYNWQEVYFLKDPVSVKAGTRFHVDAFYDNTEKNPLNPFNPPRRVTLGEQTYNEMCFVFLGGYSETKSRILPLSPLPPGSKK